MQLLSPPSPRGRVGFLVPRFTLDPDQQGLPFRSITVASALYNAGYEVAWFDQNLHERREDRTAALRDALADCRVAFLWLNELSPLVQLLHTYQLVARLKEWHPHLKLVVGGPLMSVLPAHGLPIDGDVHWFLRAHGEQCAVALLEAERKGSGFEEVPGLVWRNGSVRVNPPPKVERFLPEYTSLYRVLDLAPYVERGGIFGNDQPTLKVGTGRGCGKGCSFCYWTNQLPYLLPADAVVDLAAYLRERYAVTQLHLAELDFFTNQGRALAIARGWRERVRGASWFTLASPVDLKRLDARQLDELRDGGCLKLEMGTESGSPAMLRRLGKRHQPQDSIDLSRRLLQRGIACMHNFIFGFPGETVADRAQSCDLILRLQELHPQRMSFTFRLFEPPWDTPLGDQAIARCDGYPRTLEQIFSWRGQAAQAGTRAMHWIDHAAERRVKDLAFYYLPMTTSRLILGPAVKRALYRMLRAMALVRLRARRFEWPLDRWLFQRVIGAGLDHTFTP